ncbi:MAG: glycosyltransferase family 2 protein [Anaerolineales bacterium]|nr:glycosyltransferase family 2 protein [Anaerolineales bacterium]
MPAPNLSILIVSWNVWELLRACLRSLPLADPAVEVIVVDSASSDGTPARVAAEFPAVRVIASAENLGYSRGNNLALRAAGGRYLLVLNPDTVVAGAALAQLTAYLDAHPDVGVVGPGLVYGDGTPQPTRRRFPTLATLFFESTWLQGWAPRGLLDRYYARDLPAEQAVDVDWVVGAALLVRRAAYEQAGGFDEGFFMYSEELDWCRRLKQAGWRVVHFPPARIIHYEGRSSAQVPAATHIRFNTSKIRYTRKYHGPAAAALLRLFLLAGFACQLGLEAAKGLAGHKRALRAERVRAYWQVLRSGLQGQA